MFNEQCLSIQRIPKRYMFVIVILVISIFFYVVQPNAFLNTQLASWIEGDNHSACLDGCALHVYTDNLTQVNNANDINNGSDFQSSPNLQNNDSAAPPTTASPIFVDFELHLNISNGSDFRPTYFCDRKSSKMSDPCLCYADFQNQTVDKESIRCAMTFGASGRLGNVIGQYVTLLVLSRLNGRPSFMTPEMGDVLKHYFKVTMPHLTNEWSKGIPWTGYGIYDWMEEAYKNIPGLFVSLGGYPSSNTFFKGFKEEIRREFQVHDDIEQRAQSVLRNISSGRNSTTFIGIHVRREDYVSLMDDTYHGVLADSKYFAEATAYFRKQYSDAQFLVFSNGMDWCKENIANDKGDVHFIGNSDEGDPITDFAVLMNCNHSIITIGTFGYFAALFSGGQTVYLTNFTMPDSKWNELFHYDTAFPKDWHPIAADLSPLYAKLNNTTMIPTTTIMTTATLITTASTTTTSVTEVPTNIVSITTFSTISNTNNSIVTSSITSTA